MTRKLLLVTRPAEEAARTADAAARAGFDTMVAPLMSIEAVAAAMPDAVFDALLFTSPQGPPHAARLVPSVARLPAYVVGAATARAATASGFTVVATGDRDGTAIALRAATEGRTALLHPCGEEVSPLAVPAALRLVRLPVYRARLEPLLPEPARLALACGDVFATLLYSARTAGRFASLADLAALDRTRLRLIALSPAVAAAAGSGWAAVACAARPTTQALLAASDALWQSNAHG